MRLVHSGELYIEESHTLRSLIDGSLINLVHWTTLYTKECSTLSSLIYLRDWFIEENGAMTCPVHREGWYILKSDTLRNMVHWWVWNTSKPETLRSLINWGAPTAVKSPLAVRLPSRPRSELCYALMKLAGCPWSVLICLVSRWTPNGRV